MYIGTPEVEWATVVMLWIIYHFAYFKTICAYFLTDNTSFLSSSAFLFTCIALPCLALLHFALLCFRLHFSLYFLVAPPIAFEEMKISFS